MIANGTIDLVSLDPDLNKASFISYLQQQNKFKDYDFAGADISILLDILSINSFREAFYLNMAISEGFIDSGQLLNDVRSHAKELNYTPRSVTSAYANVTVSFNALGTSQPYIIPKGMTFSSRIKNKNLTFSTAQTLTVASANTTFSFDTNVYEGIYVKDSYYFDTSLGTPLAYKLTNPNADTSSLVVNIFENGSTIGQNYNQVTSLLDLTSNSYVFFLQCAADDGNYEVLFGDGILGYQPKNGSLVVLDYRLSSGDAGNGASNFSINFDPTGSNELTSSVDVVTNAIATGGSGAEDIETTRFYAPRWFQVQERAIVPSDYEILLKNKFPEIQNINAFGGEQLTPPQYGRVVIAVDIAGVNGLPTSKISQYTSFIKGRNPLSIQPIFMASQFMYVGVNIIARYNVNVTTETDDRIASIISSAVDQYNSNNLDAFNATFRLTPFTTFVANSDPSIVSIPTTINVYQKIFPNQNQSNYVLNYAISLDNNFAPTDISHQSNLDKTLTSSNFYYNGNLSQLEDDGGGNVRIVNVNNNNLVTVTNIGKINYEAGIVSLTNFSCDSFSGTSLNIYVIPADDDITSNQNTILAIEPDQLNISIQQLSL